MTKTRRQIYKKNRNSEPRTQAQDNAKNGKKETTEDIILSSSVEGQGGEHEVAEDLVQDILLASPSETKRDESRKKRKRKSPTRTADLVSKNIFKVPQHYSTTIFKKCESLTSNFNEDQAVFYTKNLRYLEKSQSNLLLSSVKHVVRVEIPAYYCGTESIAVIRLMDALSRKESFCLSTSSTRIKGQRIIVGKTISQLDVVDKENVACDLELRFRESTSINKRPYLLRLEIEKEGSPVAYFETEPFNVVWRDPAVKALKRKKKDLDAEDGDEDDEEDEYDLIEPYKRPVADFAERSAKRRKTGAQEEEKGEEGALEEEPRIDSVPASTDEKEVPNHPQDAQAVTIEEEPISITIDTAQQPASLSSGIFARLDKPRRRTSLEDSNISVHKPSSSTAAPFQGVHYPQAASNWYYPYHSPMHIPPFHSSPHAQAPYSSPQQPYYMYPQYHVPLYGYQHGVPNTVHKRLIPKKM